MALRITIGAAATLAALTAFASAQGEGPQYEVKHGWPQIPESLFLGQIGGVGVDSHGDVFVFHRGSSVWSGQPVTKPVPEPAVLCIEGDSGEVISKWGADTFLVPHGLTVDHEDNVWLTDVRTHQVYKYTHDGELLFTLGVEGEVGDDERHFNAPTDVAIASSGEIFVSDGYGNSRVVKFSRDGEFLLSWGKKGSGQGEFNTPHGIALDGQGRVYVTDRGNARIQIFDSEGDYIAQWSSDELGRPWGLDIVGNRVYVVDGGDMLPTGFRNHALLLDMEGAILRKWSRYGQYDGQLEWAHDVAADGDGNVYVGDVHYGMRVQKFVLEKSD